MALPKEATPPPVHSHPKNKQINKLDYSFIHKGIIIYFNGISQIHEIIVQVYKINIRSIVFFLIYFMLHFNNYVQYNSEF